MRQAASFWIVAAGVIVAGIWRGGKQTCRPPHRHRNLAAPSPTLKPKPVAGGRLHGVVKSGNIPLPGVTVTAQNTLTGKRYSTTTDITGAWSMTIPQNGRYVIRTQFAAFAPGDQEALLNAANHDQTVNFELDAGLARGSAGAATGGAGVAGGTGHPATGGQRRAKPEPGERAGAGY